MVKVISATPEKITFQLEVSKEVHYNFEYFLTENGEQIDNCWERFPDDNISFVQFDREVDDDALTEMYEAAKKHFNMQ